MAGRLDDPDRKLTTRQKQALFAKLVGELIQFAYELGYELTFGEAWRSEHEAERLAREGRVRAIRRSLHQDRLAIDLNLFHNGVWLTRTTDHKPLGEWWEQRHPLCRWGGRFEDGNHYSLEHEGRK